MYVDSNIAWDDLIDFATFSFDTAHDEGIKTNPHKLIFGESVKLPSSFEEGTVEKIFHMSIDELLDRLSSSRAQAAVRLGKAKENSKCYYDQYLNRKYFKVGNLIYLEKPRLRKMQQIIYDGPYEALRKINDYNYEINFKDGKTDVVHANRMKLAFCPAIPM